VIQSPCVRNCCLNQDDICVGCYRHIKEIVGWKNLTDPNKQEVLKNCKLRSAQFKPITQKRL